MSVVVDGQGGLEKVGHGLQSGMQLYLGVNRPEQQTQEVRLTRHTTYHIR